MALHHKFALRRVEKSGKHFVFCKPDTMRAKNASPFLLVAGMVCIVTLSYFAVFHKLDRLSLRFWDESPYAINGWKMLQHPSLIEVTDYNNQPDFWNTKPPLSTWL